MPFYRIVKFVIACAQPMDIYNAPLGLDGLSKLTMLQPESGQSADAPPLMSRLRGLSAFKIRDRDDVGAAGENLVMKRAQSLICERPRLHPGRSRWHIKHEHGPESALRQMMKASFTAAIFGMASQHGRARDAAGSSAAERTPLIQPVEEDKTNTETRAPEQKSRVSRKE